MSSKTLTLTRGDRAFKRIAVKNENWEEHFSSIGSAISSKLKQTINKSCHIVIDNNTIETSKQLGDVLSKSKDSKITVVVKDGAPTKSGIKTRVVLLDQGNKKLTWYFGKGDKKNDKIFDDFLSFVKRECGILSETNDGMTVYQIDDEASTNSLDMEIDASDDFVLCYDDVDESDTIYFAVKCQNMTYNVTVDMIECDIKEDLQINLPVASKDSEWENAYSTLVSAIGNKIGNNDWKSLYSLQDSDGVDISELDDFSMAFEELDVENGKNNITFVLKPKGDGAAIMFKILIDLSQTSGGKSIVINVPKIDLTDNDAVSAEYDKMMNKIETELGKNESIDKYTLMDKEGIDIEAIDDFSTALQDAQDDHDTEILLVLKEKTMERKVFMIDRDGERVTWRPDFENDKTWPKHYARFKRAVASQFKGVNIAKTALMLDGNQVVLTNENIAKYWKTLEDSNSSTMIFVVGGGSGSGHAPVGMKIQETSMDGAIVKAPSAEAQRAELEKEIEILNKEQKMQMAQRDMESERLQQIREAKWGQEIDNYKVAQCSQNNKITKALNEANEKWNKVGLELEVMKSLEVEKSNVITERNRPFLIGVEASVKNIMKARWDLQSSLLVVRSVMDLNPGNEEATQWKRINETCNGIYEIALESLKASLDMTGGLLLFQDALSKVKGREHENLKIVLRPLELVMDQIEAKIANCTAVYDKFETHVVKSVNTLQESMPGGKGGKSILSQMAMKIDDLTNAKTSQDKEKHEKKLALVEAENEFHSLLLKSKGAPPEMIEEWRRQRAMESGKDGAHGKDDAKDDEKSETTKTSVGNELTIEHLKEAIKKAEIEWENELKKLKKEIETAKSDEIIQEQVSKFTQFEQFTLDKKKEELVNEREKLIKQKSDYEKMVKCANESKDGETKQLRQTFLQKQSEIENAEFDASSYKAEIAKLQSEARKYREQAAQASNYTSVTESRTRYRTVKETVTIPGWFWDSKRVCKREEPYTEYYATQKYTGKKDGLNNSASIAESNAKDLEKRMMEHAAKYAKDQKLKQERLEANNKKLSEMMKQDIQSSIDTCKSMISQVDADLATNDNKMKKLSEENEELRAKRNQLVREKQKERESEIEELEREWNEKVKESETLREKIDDEWKKLQGIEMDFDAFVGKCEETIEKLTKEKAEKDKQFGNKFKMSDRGMLQLFEIAPFLQAEARKSISYAATMRKAMGIFTQLINNNKGKGLGLKEALENYGGSCKKWVEMADLLKEESFEYFSDVTCDTPKQFNALVKPTLEDCLNKCEKHKNKSDDAKAAMIEMFEAWVVKNDEMKAVDKEILENAGKNLLTLVPGCDVFCAKLYTQSEQVGRILEQYGRAMEEITLNVKGDAESYVATVPQKSIAYSSNNNEPIIEEA